MGHSVFGGMQRLNIEAARRQAGQDLLQTPNPGMPPTSTGSGTPFSLSTPDILNSLINISNPFFGSDSSLPEDNETLSQQDYEEPEKKVFANLETPFSTSSSCAISGSPSQLGLTSIASPLSVTSTSTSILSDTTGVNSPPSQNAPQPSTSVESMRSKLIKDSLKLTIQTKRKNSGKEELDVKSELVAKRPKREEVVLTYDFSISNDSIPESLSSIPLPTTKLTPEDEERRKRRRERNKVAATKCRNKKKEKTVLLVQEAEDLDAENIALRSEIAHMEAEFKRLSTLFANHIPNCVLNVEQKPATSTQPNQHQSHGLLPSMNYNTSIHQSYEHQDLNPHLPISSHHHNHFMGSNNMNNINYFGTMHHQTIQLS